MRILAVRAAIELCAGRKTVLNWKSELRTVCQ
jgi:hypothetical protein